MASTVADIMTRDPATIEAERPVSEAAELMREVNAGSVIALDNGTVAGIVTDRDIVVRVIAEHRDPAQTPVRDACSGTDVQTVGPDTSLDQAVHMMRTKAIRRLPVVENGRPVGIVSIGDLALEKDDQSALGDISSAASNV